MPLSSCPIPDGKHSLGFPDALMMTLPRHRLKGEKSRIPLSGVQERTMRCLKQTVVTNQLKRPTFGNKQLIQVPFLQFDSEREPETPNIHPHHALCSTLYLLTSQGGLVTLQFLHCNNLTHDKCLDLAVYSQCTWRQAFRVYHSALFEAALPGAITMFEGERKGSASQSKLHTQLCSDQSSCRSCRPSPAPVSTPLSFSSCISPLVNHTQLISYLCTTKQPDHATWEQHIFFLQNATRIMFSGAQVRL